MFHCALDANTHVEILQARHAEALFSLVEKNRPGLREWLPWLDDTKNLHDSREFIRNALKKYAENGAFDAGIWQGDVLAGVIGLHPISWGNRNVSIGYWLGHHARGQGLITRSCSALLKSIFCDLKIHRVEIRCAVGNRKSQKIPEALNFTKEGVLRQSEWLYDRYVDHIVYSKLSHEFKA